MYVCIYIYRERVCPIKEIKAQRGLSSHLHSSCRFSNVIKCTVLPACFVDYLILIFVVAAATMEPEISSSTDSCSGCPPHSPPSFIILHHPSSSFIILHHPSSSFIILHHPSPFHHPFIVLSSFFQHPFIILHHPFIILDSLCLLHPFRPLCPLRPPFSLSPISPLLPLPLPLPPRPPLPPQLCQISVSSAVAPASHWDAAVSPFSHCSMCAQGKKDLQNTAFASAESTSFVFHARKLLRQPAFAQTGFCPS